MTGRRALSWVVVGALLAATALAAWLAWRTERDDADRANRTLAEQAATAAQQEVALLAAALRAGDAIVRPDGSVRRDSFADFARDVLRQTQFPALAYATRIAAGERAALEGRLGNSVTRPGDGRLRPSPERAQYAPVVALHPPDAFPVDVLGFDLLSDPARRRAANRARDGGAPRLTPPLLQAGNGEVGVTVLAPVYEPGGMRGDVGNRRDALLGYFAAGITGRRVERIARNRAELAEVVRISDGDRLLAGPPTLPADSVSEEVHVLGRRWTVSVEPVVGTSIAPPLGFAIGGLALSALATSLLWSAGRHERDLRARREVAELRAARESLLTRIAESVEREIEVDARLASLARTLVPAVGDICAIHVVTAEGSVRRAGVAAVEPEVERVMQALGTPAATNPVRAAITSNQPVLYTRLSAGREGRVPPPQPPWPPSDERELSQGIASSMIVPLAARNQVLGAISLALTREGGRPAFNREDLAFVTEVASHAAVALDNARLYEQQRDIAGILQGALLPPRLPEIAGLEVAARHRPGLIGTEIGGDFYDLFESGGHWFAVVGDVCGKGPAAAALTALVRYTIRATAHEGPVAAVRRVHDAIRASDEATYCTLCCAELTPTGDGIDARVLTAGHPEPRVVSPDGTVRRLDVTGPLVGAFDDPRFGAQPLRLGTGDLLFMCSDGIPEARRNGEVFGDVRLEELLGRFAPLTADDLLIRLEAEVVHFVEGRPRDDLALFALRARGSEA